MRGQRWESKQRAKSRGNNGPLLPRDPGLASFEDLLKHLQRIQIFCPKQPVPFRGSSVSFIFLHSLSPRPTRQYIQWFSLFKAVTVHKVPTNTELVKPLVPGETCTHTII